MKNGSATGNVTVERFRTLRVFVPSSLGGFEASEALPEAATAGATGPGVGVP